MTALWGASILGYVVAGLGVYLWLDYRNLRNPWPGFDELGCARWWGDPVLLVFLIVWPLWMVAYLLRLRKKRSA